MKSDSSSPAEGYRTGIVMCLMGAVYAFICPFPGGFQNNPQIFIYAELTGILYLLLTVFFYYAGRIRKSWPIVVGSLISGVSLAFNNVHTYVVAGFDAGLSFFFLVPILYCAYYHRQWLAYAQVVMGTVSAFLQLYLGTGDLAQANTRAATVLFAYSATAWLLHYARSHERALRQQIEMEACTDHLTRLSNRRGLARWVDAHRFKTASVILMDIDHFKYINDTFGHECGDETLQRLAHAIETNLRAIDAKARIGGEEFVCVLPNASIDQACKATARISQTMRESHQPFADVTVSYGVALWNPAEDVLEKAIKRADQALYAAKQNGRNQTRLLNETREPVLLLIHSA